MSCRRLPDFLILGEAKCGSTTLWELLAHHPLVFFPVEKELHFFGSYKTFGPCGRAVDGAFAAYASQFVAAGEGQLCGEATPNYLSDPGACERIARVLPDVRLIAILRDPVQRAWSHYWHQIHRGFETLTFERALAEEQTRISSGDPDDYERFSYVTRGRYIEGLRRYEQTFGRDRLCVVFLDEVKRDAQGVMNHMVEFLGLPPQEMASAGVAHRNRTQYPKWPWLDRTTRRVRSIAEGLGPIATAPVKVVGNLTRSWRVYSGEPRMCETTRLQLEQTFAESDQQLATWLGRPLPWRHDA